MSTLFEISQTITELETQLDDLADQPQEQQALIEAWLQELAEETREERDRKLDGYACLISELQARAEARCKKPIASCNGPGLTRTKQKT